MYVLRVTRGLCGQRYREGLDLVLKLVSARVRRGEKLGIVGALTASFTFTFTFMCVFVDLWRNDAPLLLGDKVALGPGSQL